MKPEDRKRLFDVIAPQLSWEQFKRRIGSLVWLRSEIAKAIEKRHNELETAPMGAVLLGCRGDLRFLREMLEASTPKCPKCGSLVIQVCGSCS